MGAMVRNNFYVIGAGGVGSWLTPALCLLTDPEKVTVVDGDKLERKNLNRQLFNPNHIGQNKAQALAGLYNCNYIEHYYTPHIVAHIPSDILISCVDNHPARKDILWACDTFGCRCIIAGNETTSSEAFYYQPDWKGSQLDPRIFYPEIERDDSGDPRRRTIGCTGEAQKENRQLVTANFNAASLALHLVVVWAMEAPKLDKETLGCLPFHLIQNLTRSESLRVMDRQEQTETKGQVVCQQ